MKYYYHSESDSLFESDSLVENTDGGLEELTREEYIAKQREYFNSIPVLDNKIDMDFYLWKKGTSVLKIIGWFSKELQKYRK